MNADVNDAEQPSGLPPLERARGVRVRRETLDRIRAGHQAILDELKPTKAQVDRGLELHYSSFVADVQGSVQMSSTHGIVGDRLRQDLEPHRAELAKQNLAPAERQRRLDAIHFRRKTFESAFDERWIEESRALYHITGVRLGVSDVAGPEQNTFATALDRLSRINFVYDRRGLLCGNGRPATKPRPVLRARRAHVPIDLYPG